MKNPIFQQFKLSPFKDQTGTLDSIKQISPELNDFIENISERIKHDVYYLFRDDITKDINELTELIHNRQHFIIFNSPNIKGVRDTIIAHEYGHILIKKDGHQYPVVKPEYKLDKIIKDYCAAFSNMLDHKIIYENLSNFGFDIDELKNDFLWTVNSNLRSIRNDKGLPYPIIDINHPRVISFTFSFTEKFLVADFLGVTNDTFYITFKKFVENNYPRLNRRARLLKKQFERIGVETPNKRQDLLQQILSLISYNKYLNLEVLQI